MLSRESIQLVVEKHNLELLGIVKVSQEDHYAFFEQWIKEHKHAGMKYLENHSLIRKDPTLLLAGAKTAIILGMSYHQGDVYQPKNPENSFRIAQYARIKDYHKVLKAKGEEILKSLLLASAEPQVGRVLVDSVPILERSLALRTEKGFRGKNTCYIHPEKGSFLLLGEILFSGELPCDQTVNVDGSKRTAAGGCGTCQRCEINCPTGALSQYSLDANKCLSYFTIENRDVIPVPYWPWLKHYVYGCDICQLVCPYNRKSPLSQEQPVLKARLPLVETATMNQQYYEKYFGGTPLTRAKKNGLQRNALIALVVTHDPSLDQVIAHLKQEGDELLLKTIEQIKEFRGYG